MTRVAHLDEAMWTELVPGRRGLFKRRAYDILIQHLNEYREAILANKDATRLETLLREGREQKAKAGGN